MAKIKVNAEFADYLREIRTRKNISAKELAEYIEKSPAYISKLEKGEIKTIQTETFDLILGFIFNGDEEEIVNAIEHAYSKLSISVDTTPDEIKSREWFENYDKVYRKIPVPEEMKAEILAQIDESDYDLMGIVEIANQNNDVNDLKNRDDVEYNKWYYINGLYQILIKIDYDEINQVLNNTDTVANYITIEAVLLTIFKLKGNTQSRAMLEAHNLMREYNFYTLTERHFYMDRGDLLNEDDNKNRKLINSLELLLTDISDIDVKYSNQHLETMVNNLRLELAFSFAFMSVDISSLFGATREQKREFLKSLAEFIEKYAENLNNNTDNFLY